MITLTCGWCGVEVDVPASLTAGSYPCSSCGDAHGVDVAFHFAHVGWGE